MYTDMINISLLKSNRMYFAYLDNLLYVFFSTLTNFNLYMKTYNKYINK